MKWIWTGFVLLFAGLAFWATPLNEKFVVDQKWKEIEPLSQAYIELRLSNRIYGHNSPNAQKSRQEILQKFHLDYPAFKAKLEILQNDKDLWIPFQERVIAHLDSLEKEKLSNRAIDRAKSQKGKAEAE